jgi:hypothetical protein
MKITLLCKAIIGIVWALFFISDTTWAQEPPQYVKDWIEFAKTSGNEADQKWADLLNHPDVWALQKAWKEWRGYDVFQLLEEGRKKGEIPEELKPGLIITQDNYQNFPWLPKFLPQSVIDRLADKEWLPLKQIRVVPSTSYYLSKNRLEGAKKETGQFYVTEAGGVRVKNCVTCGSGGEDTWGLRSQGLPFAPNPKDGWELIWLHMAHDVGTDALYFKPIDFISCNSKNKVERIQSAHLWWMRFHGRVDYEPIPEFSRREDIFQGGAIFWLHPFDVKGLCGVRLRYFDPLKDDSFKVYIPTLKRTRILAGSDTQDPLCVNCDLTWDEWRAFWQHISRAESDYKIIGEGWILAPPERGMVDRGLVFTDCEYKSVDVELRPVWILEMRDKTGKYQYSKRVLWIDKEWYYIQDTDMYDKKGNLWRTWWDDVRFWNPQTGIAMWRGVGIWDPINRHHTYLQMNVNFEEARKGTKAQYFDIETLRTYK